MLRLPGLIYRNKLDLPSLPPAGTFDGKEVLITGASSGLGFATAVHYVNLGASSVIITARTSAKGLVAKEAIEAATGKKDVVHVMELEMSTFADTHAFAERLRAEAKDIDIALLNAGLINTSHKMGKEGYELLIQVHVLSTALLVLELLPWMKGLGGGKERHLGVVTSGLHRGVKIGEKDGWPQVDVLRYLSMEEHWPKKPGMYDVSKLLEQYVVNEVAKLSGPEVIVNPMCPGMVKSDLARDYRKNFLMSAGVDAFTTLVMKTTEGGARSTVLAGMTTPEENGKYITHYQCDEDYKKEVQHNVLCPEGQKMQAQVWGEVLDVLEKSVPGVTKIARSA